MMLYIDGKKYEKKENYGTGRGYLHAGSKSSSDSLSPVIFITYSYASAPSIRKAGNNP